MEESVKKIIMSKLNLWYCAGILLVINRNNLVKVIWHRCVTNQKLEEKYTLLHSYICI